MKNYKFTFMDNNPMQQARAISILNKKVRSNGVVMPFYKLVESFEPNLKYALSKINSNKSQKGYVESHTLGSHILNYKFEADYYFYLQSGGYSYSRFLEDEKREIEERNAESEKIYLQKRKIQMENSRVFYQKELEKIAFYLTHSLEEVIKNDAYTNQVIGRLEEIRKSKKITQDNLNAIHNYENNLKSTTNLIKTNYGIYRKIYDLSDNGKTAKPKYDYKVGQKVSFISLNSWNEEIVLIPTKIESIRENEDDSLTYILEKVEGISNKNVGYNNLMPEFNSQQSIKLAKAKVLLAKARLKLALI